MKNKFKFLEGMRSIAIIAFVMMLGFPTMASCQDRNSIVGTWTMSYVDEDNDTTATFVINSNGTGTYTIIDDGDTVVASAVTWTQSGSTVRLFITQFDASFEVTYNGGNTFVLDDFTYTKK